MTDQSVQAPSPIEPALPTSGQAADWTARGCAGAAAGLQQHLTGRRVIGTMHRGRPPIMGLLFDDGHDLPIAWPARLAAGATNTPLDLVGLVRLVGLVFAGVEPVVAVNPSEPASANPYVALAFEVDALSGARGNTVPPGTTRRVFLQYLDVVGLSCPGHTEDDEPSLFPENDVQMLCDELRPHLLRQRVTRIDPSAAPTYRLVFEGGHVLPVHPYGQTPLDIERVVGQYVVYIDYMPHYDWPSSFVRAVRLTFANDPAHCDRIRKAIKNLSDRVDELLVDPAAGWVALDVATAGLYGACADFLPHPRRVGEQTG